MMKFWIVTPSYNHLDFLRLCVASVRDQANGDIEVHHHVQDGGSTDGTRNWLKEYASEISSAALRGGYSFSFDSSEDSGMYDAINKGWSAAPAEADFIAHLNCDEQYLPHALRTIANYFRSHPAVDIALADMLVVDTDGEYICHRRSFMPKRLLSRLCCACMTTTTFQRARVLRERGVMFDSSWKNIGDMVWYNDLHRSGARFGVINEIVAVFADTGENLNLAQSALAERERYASEYLRGFRIFTRICSKYYSVLRYIKDIFIACPATYQIYWDAPSRRSTRKISRPTPLWHRAGPSKSTE